MKYGVVAIGRNEGKRLKRCLELVTTADAVVYVDLGIGRWIIKIGP